MLLAILSTSAMAKETIILAYSWSVGDNAANFYRALSREANQIQNQYTFVFEPKPGAGGTVAAYFTMTNFNNALWVSGSSGYIRPNLYPDESHVIMNFRSILPMCMSPFVISSVKYKNWKEVPRDANLSIGIAGLGTTTHLVAIQISKNYPNMNIVPFKSTSEALHHVLNGSVDFSVGFHGDGVQYTKPGSPKQIHWLGQTGRESLEGTGLLANQGFNRELLDMSTSHQIFVSRKMSEERFTSIRNILVQASRAQSVKDANAADYCVPINQMPDSQLDTWFNSQVIQWKRLTHGVKLDK